MGAAFDEFNELYHYFCMYVVEAATLQYIFTKQNVFSWGFLGLSGDPSLKGGNLLSFENKEGNGIM